MEIFLKKSRLFLWSILFWSILFPNLAFNSFTTDITDNTLQYSDLWDANERTQILQNAEFTWWFGQK